MHTQGPGPRLPLAGAPGPGDKIEVLHWFPQKPRANPEPPYPKAGNLGLSVGPQSLHIFFWEVWFLLTFLKSKDGRERLGPYFNRVHTTESSGGVQSEGSLLEPDTWITWMALVGVF